MPDVGASFASTLNEFLKGFMSGNKEARDAAALALKQKAQQDQADSAAAAAEYNRARAKSEIDRLPYQLRQDALDIQERQVKLNEAALKQSMVHWVLENSSAEDQQLLFDRMTGLSEAREAAARTRGEIADAEAQEIKNALENTPAGRAAALAAKQLAIAEAGRDISKAEIDRQMYELVEEHLALLPEEMKARAGRYLAEDTLIVKKLVEDRMGLFRTITGALIGGAGSRAGSSSATDLAIARLELATGREGSQLLQEIWSDDPAKAPFKKMYGQVSFNHLPLADALAAWRSNALLGTRIDQQYGVASMPLAIKQWTFYMIDSYTPFKPTQGAPTLIKSFDGHDVIMDESIAAQYNLFPGTNRAVRVVTEAQDVFSKRKYNLTKEGGSLLYAVPSEVLREAIMTDAQVALNFEDHVAAFSSGAMGDVDPDQRFADVLAILKPLFTPTGPQDPYLGTLHSEVMKNVLQSAQDRLRVRGDSEPYIPSMGVSAIPGPTGRPSPPALLPGTSAPGSPATTATTTPDASAFYRDRLGIPVETFPSELSEDVVKEADDYTSYIEGLRYDIERLRERVTTMRQPTVGGVGRAVTRAAEQVNKLMFPYLESYWAPLELKAATKKPQLAERAGTQFDMRVRTAEHEVYTAIEQAIRERTPGATITDIQNAAMTILRGRIPYDQLLMGAAFDDERAADLRASHVARVTTGKARPITWAPIIAEEGPREAIAAASKRMEYMLGLAELTPPVLQAERKATSMTVDLTESAPEAPLPPSLPTGRLAIASESKNRVEAAASRELKERVEVQRLAIAEAGGMQVNIPPSSDLAFRTRNPGLLRWRTKQRDWQAVEMMGYIKFPTAELGFSALVKHILSESKREGRTLETFLRDHAKASEQDESLPNEVIRALGRYQLELGGADLPVPDEDTPLRNVDAHLLARVMARIISGTTVSLGGQ